MAGLIHLYCGNGKGKTTAATGLAVRAAGAGKRVLFVQFAKDGSSSELRSLEALDGITTDYCPTHFGFFKYMTPEKREEARAAYTGLLTRAEEAARSGADLLVLDEAVSACNNGLIPEDQLVDFLRNKPEELEVVMTGRDPSQQLQDTADYITEMTLVRHPFQKGIAARKGIEY